MFNIQTTAYDGFYCLLFYFCYTSCLCKIIIPKSFVLHLWKEPLTGSVEPLVVQMYFIHFQQCETYVGFYSCSVLFSLFRSANESKQTACIVESIRKSQISNKKFCTKEISCRNYPLTTVFRHYYYKNGRNRYTVIFPWRRDYPLITAFRRSNRKIGNNFYNNSFLQTRQLQVRQILFSVTRSGYR